VAILAAREARWHRDRVTAARSRHLDDTVAEAGLIALARRGDDSAFDELVRRRQSSIRGLLRRWSGDAQLAEDLAQETFVRAWKHLGQLESPAAFGGWLRQIALNVWLELARRRKVPMGELPAGDETGEAVTPNAGLSVDLEHALAALRPAERVCIVLAIAEGMSHGEVARATGFPLGTVKSHIARGTAKLRALLEPE
jgi:RNA polymerase sigma factor (sigma-70 family)